MRRGISRARGLKPNTRIRASRRHVSHLRGSRFSVVFESSVTGDRNDYTPFLTEKVLKPIFAGHPFMLLCGARDVWDVIVAFGFRTFEPAIPRAQVRTPLPKPRARAPPLTPPPVTASRGIFHRASCLRRRQR